MTSAAGIITNGIGCDVDPLLLNIMKAHCGKIEREEVDSDIFSLYHL